MRERPPRDETFQMDTGETPLQPSPGYVEHYAGWLNRLVAEHVLAELDLETLRGINARLADGNRRGDLAAVGQELYNLGWTCERFRADPAVGLFMERLAAAWTEEVTETRAVELIQEASTPR